MTFTPTIEFQKISRSAVGFNAPQFSAATNDVNVIPNATFGGVPNAANLAIEGRFPYFNRYYILHWADNLTAIRGSHTLKAGIYVERFTRNEKKTGTVFNGAFDFQNNANNPFNTGYAYSNAALGSFNTYTQSTSREWMNIRDWDEEAFIQDNWKATRRLTLDFGLRMYWIPPMTERDNLISGFVLGQYNPAQAVKLIQPVMSGGPAGGHRPHHGQDLCGDADRRDRAGFWEPGRRHGYRIQPGIAAQLAGQEPRRAVGAAIRLRL